MIELCSAAELSEKARKFREQCGGDISWRDWVVLGIMSAGERGERWAWYKYDSDLREAFVELDSLGYKFYRDGNGMIVVSWHEDESKAEKKYGARISLGDL